MTTSDSSQQTLLVLFSLVDRGTLLEESVETLDQVLVFVIKSYVQDETQVPRSERHR